MKHSLSSVSRRRIRTGAGKFKISKDITPAANSRKSRRSFSQSALLAKSLHTANMRGFAAAHIS
jgi:hypothetical protein